MRTASDEIVRVGPVGARDRGKLLLTCNDIWHDVTCVTLTVTEAEDLAHELIVTAARVRHEQIEWKERE